MANIELYDPQPHFSADRNEAGDVIVTISTTDVSIKLDISGSYDDAVLLEASFRDLADMVRDDILEGWEDTPGEGDGYVFAPGRHGEWTAQLNGKLLPEGAAHGFPTYEIAVYELARAMHASGEESSAWCEGEHGPTTRNISDEVRAYLRGLDEQEPLPGDPSVREHVTGRNTLRKAEESPDQG